MDNTSSGLDKFLPKSIAAKRRRKRASSVSGTISSIEDNGAASRSQSAINFIGQRPGSTFSNRSTAESDGASLADDKAQTNGSEIPAIVRNDPESESATTRPTAITPHSSQIGYLTTSSPAVQAAHLPELKPAETQSSTRSSRSSTFPLNETDSTSTEETSSPRLTDTDLVSPRQSINRTPSASQLRDVFRSKKGSGNSSSEDSSKTVPADRTQDQVPSTAKLDTEAPTSTPSKTTASSDRIRRLSRTQNIEPLKPPQTPPEDKSIPPVIVNTPPTPTDSHQSDRPDETRTPSPRSNSDASFARNMISQRRGRAGSIGPSKLSNITPAPVSPNPEAGPASPNPASNFFSSMFSAVQSTANTLSNTITSTNLTQGASKSRPTTSHDQGGRESDNVEVESSSEGSPGQTMESKEPAVKTLGMGDLSLSQLGIVDPPSNAPTPVTSKFSEHESRGRSESAPVDAQGIHASQENLPEDPQYGRPRSLYEPGVTGDLTPPTGSVYEGKTGIHRSGSIRSAISRRRKRGSSVATGGTSGTGTIAAGIAAAHTSMAHASSGEPPIAPKLTGFAVANKKRNRDFHTLFKSVPDDDYLIEDYSCALQREILAHGRLYISEGHLCFSSNILGWVTTLVMSFDEIVSVEKRSTALVFKNGLEISTLHAKHIFASFASRDTTYDTIVKIWKLGHPHLQSSLNGVRLDETGGDRTEKISLEAGGELDGVGENLSVGAGTLNSVSGSDDEDSEDGDEDEEDEDVYDEDEDNDERGMDATQLSDASALDAPVEKAVTRKVSGVIGANGVAGEKQKQDAGAGGAAPTSKGTDFPGPATHAPTECGDAATHYDKVLGDDVVPAPLGKVYNLLFGPASAAWMKKFLSSDQKCLEVTMEDERGLGDDIKSRTYTYIKPLNGSIGPKQTKCIVTEELENMDLEKAVNVLVSTQNPDVPSGNIFVVKTKYCLSWAPGNATRVQVNCTIDWSAKSWLKGPIEKGANDGQAAYCKDLFVGLKAAVSSRSRSSMPVHGAGGKPKKRTGRKSKSALPSSNTASDAETRNLLKKTSAKQDWGLFEPVRPFLGPVVDTIQPILTGNVVYGLLVGLLVAMWFGFGGNANRGPVGPYGSMVGLGYANYPQRMAGYEEMWRREESELWDWIEERAGLDRLYSGMPLDRLSRSDSLKNEAKKPAGDYRTVEEKVREERMDEREVKEAIRVTEERLNLLKQVINRENGAEGKKEGNESR